MLFLQLPAEAPHSVAQRLPIADATALSLERALLSKDDATRLRELTSGFGTDGNAASWVLRIAELRSGRTINHVEQAGAWLCGCLVRELSVALSSDTPDSPSNEIGWRLPRLVAILHGCEQQCADFDGRLENEKLESLKELAYGASHEINNPLANIAARAQTLLEDEPDSERQRKLTAIHRQAMRAHEMIADLMLFARPPKLQPVYCELQPLVRKVMDEMIELARQFSVELTYECDAEPIRLMVDETQLAIAIGAIVKNALEAANENGQVEVLVRRMPAAEVPTAEILICDDGPGIPDEVRRHMFDPFYSGREAGRGLGFGASKCWRIVADHGGQLVARNRSGRGAEITILLPIRGS